MPTTATKQTAIVVGSSTSKTNLCTPHRLSGGLPLQPSLLLLYSLYRLCYLYHIKHHRRHRWSVLLWVCYMSTLLTYSVSDLARNEPTNERAPNETLLQIRRPQHSALLPSPPNTTSRPLQMLHSPTWALVNSLPWPAAMNVLFRQICGPLEPCVFVVHRVVCGHVVMGVSGVDVIYM